MPGHNAPIRRPVTPEASFGLRMAAWWNVVLVIGILAGVAQMFFRPSEVEVKPDNSHVSDDWMLVSGHCHYARDKEWFVDYKPLKNATAGGVAVAGMGTVEIRARRSKNSNEVSVLRVGNVLHVPSAICNGLNILQYPGWEWNPADLKARCLDDNENQIAYGESFQGISRLVLANWRGSSYLKTRVFKTVSIYLQPKESLRLFGNRDDEKIIPTIYASESDVVAENIALLAAQELEASQSTSSQSNAGASRSSTSESTASKSTFGASRKSTFSASSKSTAAPNFDPYANFRAEKGQPAYMGGYSMAKRGFKVKNGKLVKD